MAHNPVLGGMFGGIIGSAGTDADHVMHTSRIHSRSNDSTGHHAGGRLRREDGHYAKQCRGVGDRRFVIDDDDD